MVRRARSAPAPATETLAYLREQHPDAHCELGHSDPFTLLVAVVLSAQTTDIAVNRITPKLFARWPTARELATADVAEVEATINSIGMFRQKARNITKLAQQLVDEHGGSVPRKLDALVALPGVGRKTANVVLGVAFGAPEGVVVDTHVLRIAQRLGWTQETMADRVERDLMALFPREDWDILSHTVIFHGRRICTARQPACEACRVNEACPSAFSAENVGRKAQHVPALRAVSGEKRVTKRSRARAKAEGVLGKDAIAPRAETASARVNSRKSDKRAPGSNTELQRSASSKGSKRG